VSTDQTQPTRLFGREHELRDVGAGFSPAYQSERRDRRRGLGGPGERQRRLVPVPSFAGAIGDRQAASRDWRAEVHEAFARPRPPIRTATWHRALAASQPDEELAEALDAGADGPRRTGHPTWLRSG